MKNTNTQSKQSARSRIPKGTPVVPVVIRRPFSDPIPLQDQLARKFGWGPARPTKPGTQI